MVLLCSTLMSTELPLKSGWNLVGIDAPLTLDEIKTQLGTNNLLVIQGPKKVYKKAHVDANLNNLNDFTAFEKNKGYWVKLEHNATLTYTPVAQHQNSETLTLKEGWNLISPTKKLSLKALLNKIGRENLLVVQGEDRTYQKRYIDEGFSAANDLDILELGKGYWVKVAQAKDVELIFNVDKPAIDNRGVVVVKDFIVNSITYTLKVFANTTPTSETSTSTIALLGNINGVNTGALLKLNSNYTTGTAFVVKVYKADEEVGSSLEVKYSSSAIDFGNITFNEKSTTIDNTLDDTTFGGVRVFAQPLSSDEYGLEQVSDADFNLLSSDNQQKVAVKILSTLFAGMSGTERQNLIGSGKFISTIQARLAEHNSDIKKAEQEIAQKDYSWSEADSNREKILARLMHLGLGKEYLRRWIAYVLTQNILFSPANSLETVENSDIYGVYNRLVRLMDDDYSMRMISYLQMTSEENWRRFRSPEDNGREMLEIFTLDFNDADVPKAAIALQNWRLNRRDNELVIGLVENDVPQNLFGTTVTNGFDFYREMVKSSAFLKGVMTRIVNQYFPQYTKVQKKSVIDAIVGSNPTRFEDIFLQILFSKAYLLNDSRVKMVEETVFYLAKSSAFFDKRGFYRYMRDRMDKMHQSSLNYKLGRDNIVPTDTLSFAYYYDFIRRYMMNDAKNDEYNDWDGGWRFEFIAPTIVGTDSVDGLIDYIFETILARHATQEELDTIRNYAVNDARGKYSDMSINNHRLGVAQITMEYLSRLSELYRFEKIEE